MSSTTEAAPITPGAAAWAGYEAWDGLAAAAAGRGDAGLEAASPAVPTDEPELDPELEAARQRAEAEAAKAAGEPDGLVGERDCPLCDGAGKIPYGLLESPRYERCPECGGVGDVRTGSLVSEAAVAPCERCTGSGFVAREDAATTPAPAPRPAETFTDPPWPGATWDDVAGEWR